MERRRKTRYPPKDKPVMVWDGECPFCKFWIAYLSRYTGQRVDYVPFQQASTWIKDIPPGVFRQAVQFIEPDGTVYGGLDAAYKSFYYLDRPVLFLHQRYETSPGFARVSDHLYGFISARRPLMCRLTRWFFGQNPETLKPYFLVWGMVIWLVFRTLKTGTK